MGPSQICGCPFREPRVFEIAHLGMGTWGWRMGHHSPCFDFIWVNDFEPFGDLCLFSRACEPQVDWSCLMLSSDPMFRRYQPRTFPFSEEDEDERLCPNHKDLPVPRSKWFVHRDTMLLAWRELRASLSFISHRCLPSRLQEHHYLDIFRLESCVILMLKDSWSFLFWGESGSLIHWSDAAGSCQELLCCRAISFWAQAWSCPGCCSRITAQQCLAVRWSVLPGSACITQTQLSLWLRACLLQWFVKQDDSQMILVWFTLHRFNFISPFTKMKPIWDQYEPVEYLMFLAWQRGWTIKLHRFFRALCPVLCPASSGRTGRAVCETFRGATCWGSVGHGSGLHTIVCHSCSTVHKQPF